MSKNHKGKYYLSLLAAIVIWGSLFVFSKSALTQVGPVMVVTIRIVIAFLVLLPMAIRKGFRFSHVFSKQGLIYGALGCAFHMMFLNWGLGYCSATISAMLQTLLPIFALFLGAGMLGEKITKSKGMGAAISITGAIILSVGSIALDVSTTFLGVALILLSGFLWAVYCAYTKKVANHLNAFVLSEVTFGGGLVLLLPFTFIEACYIGLPTFNFPLVMNLFYLGALCSAVAIVLWNYGLKGVEASSAGIFYNFTPVVGVIFGLAAGEKLLLIQAIGCIIVFSGVFIGIRAQSKEETEEIKRGPKI